MSALERGDLGEGLRVGEREELLKVSAELVKVGESGVHCVHHRFRYCTPLPLPLPLPFTPFHHLKPSFFLCYLNQSNSLYLRTALPSTRTTLLATSATTVTGWR